MSETRAAPDASLRLGGYEVLLELAQGGMGAVFLARTTGDASGAAGFERLVAVKRLHLHLTAQPESVQRFLDEAKVAARIHHANVVGIHQVGSDDAGPFLVQDYVEGDTLQGLIDHATLKRRRLPPPVVLRIALDALSGLAAVHDATDTEGRSLGILHRDVSTQNLLVGRDGVTRLADFGIAKHTLRSVVTDGQYLQGRVLYMPPEYLARRPIDARFDVYGVGVTLWTALSGEAPFAEASDAQLVSLAVTEGIPRLSSSGLAIAPAVEEIVARACQRDPAARFASAREMLDAIEDLGRHTGWIASHGEVAELVDDLVGRELVSRRAALTRARGQEARADGTPTATTAPVRAAPRRLGGATLAVGAALVVTAAVTALATGRAHGVAAQPRLDTSAAPATEAAPLASSAPAQATSAPAPATTPRADATASAARPAPALKHGAPTPRDRSNGARDTVTPPIAAPEPPRTTKAAPPQVEAPAPAPTAAAVPVIAPAPAPTPTGITTANPYRLAPDDGSRR